MNSMSILEITNYKKLKKMRSNWTILINFYTLSNHIKLIIRGKSIMRQLKMKKNYKHLILNFYNKSNRKLVLWGQLNIFPKCVNSQY